MTKTIRLSDEQDMALGNAIRDRIYAFYEEATKAVPDPDAKFAAAARCYGLFCLMKDLEMVDPSTGERLNVYVTQFIHNQRLVDNVPDQKSAG